MTESPDELEKLLLMSDNYTLYKLCAIINAVYHLSNGTFVGEERMATDSPAEVFYSNYNPGITDIVRAALDAFPEQSEYSTTEETVFKIFLPTEEQRRQLDTLFTSGTCYFYMAWPSTTNPRRLVWEWKAKVSDLNLRTKAGREEKVRRMAALQEEGKMLLNRIRNTFTADFADLVIAQEKQQRFDYDRAIPTGKTNARMISSDEYDRLLRQMDRGGFYIEEPAMLKIWKTPSDVQRWTIAEKAIAEIDKQN